MGLLLVSAHFTVASLTDCTFFDRQSPKRHSADFFLWVARKLRCQKMWVSSWKPEVI